MGSVALYIFKSIIRTSHPVHCTMYSYVSFFLILSFTITIIPMFFYDNKENYFSGVVWIKIYLRSGGLKKTDGGGNSASDSDLSKVLPLPQGWVEENRWWR